MAQQWKVAGEQKDPLKSYCSGSKANHLLLGYPKIPGFCLSSSRSIPCAGKELPKAPHLTLLHGWHTLSSLDRLLGKLDLPWKHAQWWCHMGVKLEPGQLRGQSCPRSSEGQLQCLYRGRHLSGACVRLGTWVHPQERDWARQLGLRQPELAPAMEHLDRTLAPAGVEGVLHRGNGCRRGWF